MVYIIYKVYNSTLSNDWLHPDISSSSEFTDFRIWTAASSPWSSWVKGRYRIHMDTKNCQTVMTVISGELSQVPGCQTVRRVKTVMSGEPA